MPMTALPPLVQSQVIYQQTVRQLTGLDAQDAEQAVITRKVPRGLDQQVVSDRTFRFFHISRSGNKAAFWRGRRTAAQRLDYLLLTARILAQLQPVLGEAGARRWLQEPNEHLSSLTPLELLRTSTGERRVQSLLESLLNGYYA